MKRVEHTLKMFAPSSIERSFSIALVIRSTRHLQALQEKARERETFNSAIERHTGLRDIAKSARLRKIHICARATTRECHSPF